MGANDTLGWVRREIDWLEIPLAEDKPVLGLCLGAQMLARALGTRAFSYDDNRSEIGPRRRARFSALRDSTHGLPMAFRRLDLTEGSEFLAVGVNFPNQAFRYGRHAVGLQFHPEVTHHMMCRWTHRGAERLTRLGALSRHEHLAGWFQHDGRVAAWLEEFLPAWLERRPAEPVPKPGPASPPNGAPERKVSAIRQAAL